ncbi:glycosyltransferase family 8 protein [Photobacterium andalusiense]|uniref:General stress protein A n=1 Tax=Photobacterium andalusiense TaxID=2204296 RepID=A0A1Y6MHF0_9GAMM|nr:glycosyltransferase [Photobacterium andalusiense]SMY35966.1 General stress protein A [Photobacterium andalusiense]
MSLKTVVAWCSDSNYRKLLEVSFYSFAINNKNSKAYIIKYDDFNEDNLIAIAEEYNIELLFFKLTDDDLPPIGRYSRAMYGRLYLTELINDEVFIYLDCDTIITSNLNSLINTRLGINNISMLKEKNTNIIKNRLSSLDINDYFNSGVIVISNSLSTKKNMRDVINYIKKNIDILVYPDQDALNVIFSNKIKKLDSKYNYIYPKKSNEMPIIIHYAHEKPWLPLNNNYYSYIYFDLIDDGYRYMLSEYSPIQLSKNYIIIKFFKNILKKLNIISLIQFIKWRIVK